MNLLSSVLKKHLIFFYLYVTFSVIIPIFVIAQKYNLISTVNIPETQSVKLSGALIIIIIIIFLFIKNRFNEIGEWYKNSAFKHFGDGLIMPIILVVFFLITSVSVNHIDRLLYIFRWSMIFNLVGFIFRTLWIIFRPNPIKVQAEANAKAQLEQQIQIELKAKVEADKRYLETVKASHEAKEKLEKVEKK
jgi:hypothetical protein